MAVLSNRVVKSQYGLSVEFTMKKGGFAAERADKFMDMFYHFENHAQDEEAHKYLDNENREFSQIANFVLDIPYKWETIFFHSEDGFYINTYREFAFQKYCLMLDCIIPLKNQYIASPPFVSSELMARKREVETILSTQLELSENQEPDYILLMDTILRNT